MTGEFETRWDVTLRFNGRLTGAGQFVRIRVTCEDPLEAVKAAELHAVRQAKHGGAIFITGHTVEAAQLLTAQVAKWNAEWLDCESKIGKHWGDEIDWGTAMEIARRLDERTEL